MPANASVAPKPAPPKAKAASVNRAPIKAPPPAHSPPIRTQSAPRAAALPAFARPRVVAPSTGATEARPTIASAPSLAHAASAAAKPVASPKPSAAASPTIAARAVAAAKAFTTPLRKIIPIALKGEGHSAGQPLEPQVRSALEASFHVDFEAVRVHHDEAAKQTAGTVAARAFTFGSHIFLGPGERADDLGLIAHEVAHIVQQQQAPAYQMFSPAHTDAYEGEAHHASAAVQRGDAFHINERVTEPQIQRFPGKQKILNYLADKAYNIWGYRMFTVLLGKNPINGEAVERSAANIMRAIVEFLPGGHQIVEVLDKYEVFDKVGNWATEQLSKLKSIVLGIVDAFWDFVSSLGISDVPHPIRTWERAVDIFTPPIHQIIDFIEGLAEGIWHFIRDAVLKPIARLAEGRPGWDLLLAVLGHNPITGEKVASDADAVIGGFMKLIGQEEIYNNIKKANAISRCWTWFTTNVKQLLAFVSEIPSLFIEALKSLSLSDIFDLPAGFMKIVHVFGSFAGRFISWALDATWSLLQIIFEVVAPGAMPYLKKLGASFRQVLKNPMGFVHNLVAAAKLGFHQFANNIGKHLKAAFISWLTGNLPGVYIPTSFDFSEIIKFVLSVLGLTWTNIRAKLVKVMGEPAVKALEGTFDIVMALITDGPAAAWEKIKEYAGNLRDMAINAIMDYIVIEVVKKAIAKIASMFIPGAAFISAIISIYDTIVVFISKLSKMIQIATAFLNSMMEIASGAIPAAALKIEDTLEGLLSLAISFLAGFLGLGKIADKVMGIINTKIRAPIDKALDQVIDWIATGAKKLYSVAKKGAAKLFLWWKQRFSFNADGESHSLYFAGDSPAAQLTVASEPKDIRTFLAEHAKGAAKSAAKQRIIASINKQVTAIEKLGKLTDDQQQAREGEFKAAFNAIGPLLVALLSDDEWGTEIEPAPLEYTKRRAAAYDAVYVGPKTENVIPQALLRQNKVAAIKQLLQDDKELKAWKARNFAIVKCPPLGQTTLPDGSATIGIQESHQIGVGKKLLYSPGKTMGGGLINKTLKPFGYSATAEGKDGDHVVEMQIGGPNDLANLWPLEAGENRSSGSLLSNATVTNPDGKELTLQQASKKKKNQLWLMIVKTR